MLSRSPQTRAIEPRSGQWQPAACMPLDEGATGYQEQYLLMKGPSACAWPQWGMAASGSASEASLNARSASSMLKFQACRRPCTTHKSTDALQDLPTAHIPATFQAYLEPRRQPQSHLLCPIHKSKLGAKVGY